MLILARRSRNWNNTKRAKMPYFHCGPFKKEKEKWLGIGEKISDVIYYNNNGINSKQ